MRIKDKVLVKSSAYNKAGQVGTITEITTEELIPVSDTTKKYLYILYTVQFSDLSIDKFTEKDLDNIISIAERLINAEKEVAQLRSAFTILKTLY